jgi:hypothetical protein
MGQDSDRQALVWEKLNSKGGGVLMHWETHRAKVPGGWLVLVVQNTTGLTFYPDPDHRWDGSSQS